MFEFPEQILNTRLIDLAVCGVLAVCFLMIATPLNAQSERAAQTLERAGKYGGAFLEYRKVFRDNPTYTPAILGMLRNGIRIERWGAAQRALENYKELRPGTDTAALLGTRLYYQQAQYDTALEWANRAKERLTGSWKPYYLTAEVQFKRGNYVEARNNLRSARVRTTDNQWVQLLDLLTSYTLEGYYEEETLDELRSTARHPQVFWALADFDGIDWTRKEAVQLLDEASDSFPAPDPPLRQTVSEDRYRYRLSLLQRRINKPSEARETIGSVQSDNPEIRWLQAVLIEDPNRRLTEQRNVLRDVPDRLPYQWTHSTLARRMEGLTGQNRSKSSDFFYDEYENTELFGYPEASLSSLSRSLELQPTEATRQFDLAEYFHARGWKQSELRVLERVRELGIRSPTRINDYLEGLEVDTDPKQPPIPRARLIVDVSLNTLWDGPADGQSVLERMTAHALFHQPVFEPVRSQAATGSDTPVPLLIDNEKADGAVEVDVTRWEEAIEATITLHLPNNQVDEQTFYARGRMKPWRLIHEIVTSLKQQWPWTGTVYRQDGSGAWINLGRAHGVDGDASFDVDGRELDVGAIFERRLQLTYPTPVLKGKIERGERGQLLPEGNQGD